MEKNLSPQVVCFGEVLWDILPDGTVPGGAPVNVAYHLHQQNINAAVFTRVGHDDEGKQLLDIFAKKGLDTQYFQVDEKYETGKVYATQDEKKDMRYEIVQPVAWDFIEWEKRLDELVKGASYFVYGSLAARSRQSADTLFRLLEVAGKKVFDINLRAPHYKKEMLVQLLQKTDFLKMNFEELDYVSAWFGDVQTIEDRIKMISDKYDIPRMVVTKGKDGAIMFNDGGFYYHEGITVNVKDTVGSGDAFLSGVLASLIKGRSIPETLQWASCMGAYVATRTGACPEYNIADINKLMA